MQKPRPTRPVLIRLDPPDYAALKQDATDLERPVAWVVRQIVEQHYRRFPLKNAA